MLRNRKLLIASIVGAALIINIIIFLVIFRPSHEGYALPGDLDSSIPYEIQATAHTLSIPSAELVADVVVTEGTQDAIDLYDVVQDSRCSNIRLLGHNTRSLSKLHNVEVGTIFTYSGTAYKVVFSSKGTCNDSLTNIFDADGSPLLGRHDIEIITCDGTTEDGRYVVLADYIQWATEPILGSN